MKKKILATSLAALLLAGLTACGETPTPTTAPTEAPTQVPTTAPTQVPTTAPTEAPTSAPASTTVAPTVTAVSVDTTAATTVYTVGDAFTTTGVKLTYTYSDSTTTEVTDLTGYTVTVKNANGEVVTEFAKAGEYTVTISDGTNEVSYTVTVNKVVLTIAQAIAKAEENKGKISEGAIDITEQGFTDEITFAFGDNYFTYHKKDAWDEVSEYHYSLDQYEEILGIAIENGEAGAAWDATVDNLDGYGYRAFGYDYTYYGVEALVAALYETFAEGTNATESVEDNTYSFAYDYKVFSYTNDWDYETPVDIYNFYAVSCSFTLADDETIAAATVSISTYYNDSVVVNEDGTWAPAVVEGEAAPADSTMVYEVSQTSGERTAVNNYSEESIKVSAYDLIKDGEVLAEGSYTIDAGYSNGYELEIGNVAPSTALMGMNEVITSVTDALGQESEGLSAYYSTWSNTLTIYGTNEGTYTVTVTINEVTKTYEFTVTVPNPTSVFVEVYADTGAGYSSFTEYSTYTMYRGTTVYFKGATPASTKEGWTITPARNVLSSGIFTEDVTMDGEICVSYNPLANGTYQFQVASTADPSVTAIFTLEVVDAPSIAEILSGTHDYNYGTATLEFSPVSEGATEGFVSFEYSAYDPMVWDWVSYSGSYVYRYADGAITLTPSGSYDFTLELSISENYKVVATINDHIVATFAKQEAAADPFAGKVYSGYIEDGTNDISCQLYFQENGTGYMAWNANGTPAYPDFTYQMYDVGMVVLAFNFANGNEYFSFNELYYEDGILSGYTEYGYIELQLW